MAYELSDLSRSVFSTLGLSSTTDTLHIGSNPSMRECIFLVDGLGKNAIDNYGSNYPNISALKYSQTLQATFPSTTATSLTSLGTGRRAGDHGMVGYTMRVPHSGVPERLINALKWDERIDPYIWQPHQTLFESAVAEGIDVHSVAGKRYENTGFTRAALRGGIYHGANSPSDLISETIAGLKRERSFVYLYVNDVDDASHNEGFGSERFLSALAKVDSLIGELCEKLPTGTRLWVTADHGMINREDFIVLGKGNDLLENVDLLGGEPRSRYIYCQQEKVSQIRSRWEEELGEKVSIFTRDQAIADGLFGPHVSDSVRERIGDLIVVANGNFILVEPEREALQCAMVGHHGGLTPAEVEIPLLTYSA